MIFITGTMVIVGITSLVIVAYEKGRRVQVEADFAEQKKINERLTKQPRTKKETRDDYSSEDEEDELSPLSA